MEESIEIERVPAREIKVHDIVSISFADEDLMHLWGPVTGLRHGRDEFRRLVIHATVDVDGEEFKTIWVHAWDMVERNKK